MKQNTVADIPTQQPVESDILRCGTLTAFHWAQMSHDITPPPPPVHISKAHK